MKVRWGAGNAPSASGLLVGARLVLSDEERGNDRVW
jgi:hypothetical protein